MYFEGRDYLRFVFYDKVLCTCISGYIKFVLYINYKIFDLVYIYLFVYMFLSL